MIDYDLQNLVTYAQSSVQSACAIMCYIRDNANGIKQLSDDGIEGLKEMINEATTSLQHADRQLSDAWHKISNQ